VAKIVLEYYNLRQENNLYEVEVIELREALVLRTEQVVQFRAAQSMLQAELQIERDVRKTYQERAEMTTRKAKIMKVLAITGAVVAGGLAVGLVVK
jgi:energy-converting hydrogenase Eha subunit H